MLKSSSDRYGAVPVTIHWLTAILILLALGSGFQADNALDAHTKTICLRVHVPTAIFLLLLTAFRIVWWWFVDSKPEPRQDTSLWQQRLARGVHLAFYVVILGMIVSGVGMIVLSGAGPAIFGEPAAALPNFDQYPPRVPHGLGANLMVALLLAHVGAALYHHFIRRDGLLWRMWYRA
ncbi:cytochrome b [Bradyrhizobium sp. BRP22]|uniref:cytochrome b n=1 Tax=Bradyrhizobium sp. BRP22 TaxID=2793821 RepID=UPI001CD61701|nr:cytochrome b/b6 domain-containing protein [Bradyrhizobium sp. BRP22]MCA1458768.1 cytochrome b [Bradyrhizobium sp. BRP22]